MLLQSLKADEHYHWFKVCFSMSLWLLSFWKMLPKQVHNWEKKTVFGSKKVAQKWAKQKTHKIQPFKTHKLSFMVKLLIETASVEYTICSHRQLSADPESRWIHLYKESLSCTPQLWCVMMLLFSLSLLRGRTICLWLIGKFYLFIYWAIAATGLKCSTIDKSSALKHFCNTLFPRLWKNVWFYGHCKYSLIALYLDITILNLKQKLHFILFYPKIALLLYIFF